jgi:hypothetical protein
VFEWILRPGRGYENKTLLVITTGTCMYLELQELALELVVAAEKHLIFRLLSKTLQENEKSVPGITESF